MKLRTRWVKGERTMVPVPTKKDGGVMTGKNGGPVVKQSVTKVIEPRG